MANANVIAGSNRLKHAIRALQEHWLATEATWNDSVRQRFEERYLAPLDPAVDAAVIGMQKLAEVLDQVRRDLTDRSETPVSTVQRTPPAGPPASPPAAPEPDAHPAASARRSRELLRLVAERAAAEAEVEATRVVGRRRGRPRVRAGAAGARREVRGARRRRAARPTRRPPGDRRRGRSRARRRPRPSSPRPAARSPPSSTPSASRPRPTTPAPSRRPPPRSRPARRRPPPSSPRRGGRSTRRRSSSTSMHARLAAVFADYQKFGLAEPPTTPTRETYQVRRPGRHDLRPARQGRARR